MTTLAQAFAQSGKYVVSYRKKYHVGIVEFKLSNLSEEINKLDDGRYFRRTALPCGKGTVVNVTVFGELKYLRRLQKNKSYKVGAAITEKTIANGNVRKFYNLDLSLVHPDSNVVAEIKVTQQVSKKETGKIFKCPQGGAIVISHF